MNTPQLNSPKKNYKITNTIFIALLAGMFFMLTAAYFVVSNNEYQKNDSLFNILLLVNAFLAGLMIFVPRKIYETAVSGYDKSLGLNSKIIHHRTQNIVRWAMIETSVLFAIVSSFVTGDLIFLAFALIMITFFYLHRPTISKFAADYMLSNEDRSKLLD